MFILEGDNLMSETNAKALIPPQLEEMVDAIMNGLVVPGDRHATLMAYTGGWLRGRAREEYKELCERDGIPEDGRVVKLLCELALMRALVKWHEVRDRPPPMPTIDSL
ncbi:MAG: hypothetical protein JWO84_295 [Parcubacteria group bacterium]|nr:hypothetical protein [Parcubacteria group bacterium]